MDAQFQKERKRKLMLALPVLVLPFLTILFYSLGGGKGLATSNGNRSNALSFTLPDPLPDNTKPMDKLGLYQEAEKDSFTKQRAKRFDPFAPWMPQDSSSPLSLNNDLHVTERSPYTFSASQATNQVSGKTKADDLERKMADLQNLLRVKDTSALINEPNTNSNPSGSDAELQHLESMMRGLSGTQDTQQDAVLTQANDVLEKIMDVQHPSRVTDRLREQSEQNKGKVYAVNNEPEKEITDLFTAPLRSETTIVPYAQAKFYDDDEQKSEYANQNALAAVVHENQTLISGATIKLRLEQDAYVQGVLIPKGSFVYGKCSLNGERLIVSVNAIRYGNAIFPVSLTAYDLDGIVGLRIPGSINRDASKEGTEQMLQALSIGSLNPSLGAQATSAGIDIAKNLLTRKVKLIRVSVKAGYPLLLASSSGL